MVPTPYHVLIVAMSSRSAYFGGNFVATLPDDASACCSAPPLQSAFRLPRLSRDAEAVTRPRMPLRPMKWEQASEVGAVVEFHIKVEAEGEAEEPAEEGAEAGRVRAQFAAIDIAPPARKPGRPKGSRSRPRVTPEFDKSAPPEREQARKAAARIARIARDNKRR